MTFCIFDLHLGPELTEAMVVNMSRRLTSATEVRQLGIKGLRIRKHIVDKHLNNERDISEAAYKVLDEWCKDQLNSRVAHSTLCGTLRRVGMSAHVKLLQIVEDPEEVSENGKNESPPVEQKASPHRQLVPKISPMEENVVTEGSKNRKFAGWLQAFRKHSQTVGMLCAGACIGVCVYKCSQLLLKRSK